MPLLQKINNTLRSELNINQWQNSSEVIDWFKYIPQKSLYNFCLWHSRILSINQKKTVERCPAFAQSNLEIKQNELDLIFHTQK